jgi:exosortase/archaeosortase family protein
MEILFMWPVKFRNPAGSFVVRFLILAACLVLLVQVSSDTRWLRAVIGTLTLLNATIAHGILALFGADAQRYGDVIRSNQDFIMEVSELCIGPVATVVFFCAVVCFPVRWKSRAMGFLWGLLLFSGLNQIRIVSLYYLGTDFPSLFDEFHSYIWPLVLDVSLALYFCIWAARQLDLGTAEAESQDPS